MQTENWQRIRNTLLDPFDRAIQNLFDATDFEDNLREPVNVAIDVTPWQFHPSPYDDEDNPKPDFPKMVSGTKEQDVRAYKFATVTVVGEDTPLVLGVEPVKEDSTWETDDGVTRTPLSDVVERLLSTAEEYVDIHKVFCDREFSSHRVRGVIDRKGLTYVIPKPGQAKQDLEDIEDVKQHETADMGVRVNPLTVDGRTHDVAFMYIPSESGSYNIFTTNAEVPPGRIQGLTEQYRDRWMIEIEYRTIKQNFLPLTTSKDYRVRLFHFIAAVIMYNVWRVTNVLLRTVYGYERNLGDSPLVPAGEIPEVVRMTLGFNTGIG
jgi:IS4 transposase